VIKIFCGFLAALFVLPPGAPDYTVAIVILAIGLALS
jgi:hypothetical protein